MQTKITSLDRYPGNKSSTSIFPIIVNHVPLHTHYFEIFAGSAFIHQKIHYCASKKRALLPVKNIRCFLNDLNPDVFELLSVKFPSPVVVTNLTAFFMLEYIHDLVNLHSVNPSDVFVYVDPPYLHSTRRSGRDIYKYEMCVQDHVALLNYIGHAKFNCMISHYECDLYNHLLADWKRFSFPVSTRRGVVSESIYMNYDIAKLPLHNPSYVGENRTDRQRIKRKLSNLHDKINSLSLHESQLYHSMFPNDNFTAV